MLQPWRPGLLPWQQVPERLLLKPQVPERLPWGPVLVQQVQQVRPVLGQQVRPVLVQQVRERLLWGREQLSRVQPGWLISA